jgi:hypothetical protein
MHVDDPPRPCALVQIVDVLRHQGEMAAALGERRLESRQRSMGGVGFGVEEVAAAQIIERENVIGIAGEGFRRRQLHRVEPRPDPLPALVAKRAEPALSRNPGAGQNEDLPARAHSSGNPTLRRLSNVGSSTGLWSVSHLTESFGLSRRASSSAAFASLSSPLSAWAAARLR